MRLIAILQRSQLNCPGKLKHYVTSLMVALTKWLRSPYVGVAGYKDQVRMYNATLSNSIHSFALLTNWWKDNTALKAHHCVGYLWQWDGIKCLRIRSGYPPRTFKMSNVPISDQYLLPALICPKSKSGA